MRRETSNLQLTKNGIFHSERNGQRTPGLNNYRESRTIPSNEFREYLKSLDLSINEAATLLGKRRKMVSEFCSDGGKNIKHQDFIELDRLYGYAFQAQENGEIELLDKAGFTIIRQDHIEDVRRELREEAKQLYS